MRRRWSWLRARRPRRGGLSKFPSQADLCQPAAEACDGLDNDCDGKTDELGDLAEAGVVGVACGSDQGECRLGVATCVQGALACDGQTPPAQETCDGRDEDCDGEIDERSDLAAAGLVGVPCGSDAGRCEQGIAVCAGGVLGCEGGTPPGEETCDGVDDDCDGEVDEASTGVCEACTPEGASGQCRFGVNICADGSLVCAPHPSVAAVAPCDLLDNDCDGAFDEALEAPPAIDGLSAVAAEQCGEAPVRLEGLPAPGDECAVEPREIGCETIHACLPSECLDGCRATARADGELAECMTRCAEGAGGRQWSCAGGAGGPQCEALGCIDGFRLERGRCVPNVETCNNGVDDDGDGLIDGTLVGEDPCAAEIDSRGDPYQFSVCTSAGAEGCEDSERVGHEGEEQCHGDDCPFMVELTYAYSLDKEEVSFRAYGECVEAGCCEPPTGRLWHHLQTATAARQGAPPPPRPESPARCMLPPVLLPAGAAPGVGGMPEDGITTDDPLLLDLPVSSVSWCQARAYCEWVGKRLPTEYEWERAAMGLGARRAYGWGDDPPATCPELDCCRAPGFQVEGEPPQGCDPELPVLPICDANIPEETRRRCLANTGAGADCADSELDEECPECLRASAPVWSNEDGATPLGIVNLVGNVSEWVHDWHHWGFDHGDPDGRTDPIGKACSNSRDDYRAMRGSSFADRGKPLRSIDRQRNQPTTRAPIVGFRCARTVEDDGELCAPGIPNVPAACSRQGDDLCAAPDFQTPKEVDLSTCADGLPEQTVTCDDPRDRLCATDSRPGCGALLLKRLRANGQAILDFVPRSLLAALGVDEEALGLGRFDGAVDSLLRTALAPAGGDAIMIFDPHPDLGRVDGELPAQVGAGHIDEAGRLSFAAYRTDDVCEPMDRTELSLRSEAGALEVRAICGLDPWDLVLPDVARSLRGSSLFLEAERTETGVEGSVLAIVSQEAAQRWTLGEPPRPAPWSAADIRAPLLSLCELFDLLGCQVKPAGCPAERLAPCPPRVESCRGFIFPFEVEFVRAQQAGIPGLAACHEDAGD